MPETDELGNTLFIEVDETRFASILREQIENNKVSLPPLFNDQHAKFVGLSHLYSIYYDSYKCILCGLYHPGIMLMGQLIEASLKEIILVHDGINDERSFGALINYSENLNGTQRRGHQDPLVSPPINLMFRRVKDILRNPYMHLNYSSIFQGERIRGVRFEVGHSYEEIIRNVQSIRDRIERGEITPVEIDPIIDRVIADQTKRQNDPKWAITWAWEIFPFFEILVDEYLSIEDYRIHTERHGSEYDTIPMVENE